MFYKNMLKLLAGVLSLSCLLLACVYDHTQEEKWTNWENEIAPLTQEENKFIDSLKQEGFACTLEHTFIGRRYRTDYEIEVLLDSTQIYPDLRAKFQFNKFRNKLIDILYRDVISDSVLYDIDLFVFTFNDLNRKGKQIIPKTLDNYYKLDKESVGKRNHFKVISNGKQFYRVRI